MTKIELCEIIDDVTESQPGTVNGDEVLTEIEGWDSMSVISFQSIMNEKFGLIFTGKQLMSAKTVDDLMRLVNEHIEG